MIVVLFNKQEIVITKQEADAIDSMIETDVKWIKIGDFRVRPSAIMLIKPGGVAEADLTHRIEAHDYRGEYSPAKEKIKEQLNARRATS